MDLKKIRPINNNHLVQLEEHNAGRIILLGSKRSIAAAHYGNCIRSPRYEGCRVLCSTGGIPVGDRPGLVFVSEDSIVAIDDTLREPYIHITPIEITISKIIDVVVNRFSGWYKVLDTYPGCVLEAGQIVVPIYGQPRLEMEDDTEYCSIEAIGVYDERPDSDAADDQCAGGEDQGTH